MLNLKFNENNIIVQVVLNANNLTDIENMLEKVPNLYLIMLIIDHKQTKHFSLLGWASLVDSKPHENCVSTVETKDGTIWDTRKLILEQDGRLILSEDPLTPKESCWKKLVSRPNSPTQPSESVSEYS